jgi:hypothetical protein
LDKPLNNLAEKHPGAFPKWNKFTQSNCFHSDEKYIQTDCFIYNSEKYLIF